jgi:thiamine biosynthesis lipoprotein
MQIDLGGVAKEYAVDSALIKITKLFDVPILLNFGGDLSANKAPKKSTGWKIAIENNKVEKIITLSKGAITTSGNRNRYVIYKGKKLSHIINPKTGWPEVNAPISVTIHANTCSEAGFLSTIAMLLNDKAREFLEQQNINYEIEY